MLRKITQEHKKSACFLVKLFSLCVIILLGALLGYFSEWLEYGIYYSEHPLLNYHNDILVFAGTMLNNLGCWIFFASLIAYFSLGPFNAGVNTLSFFLAMCIAYFIPKHLHFGYSVRYQLLFWVGIAIVSSLAAVLIWYSKVGGLFGILIKSLPISAILSEGAYIIIFNRLRYYRPISTSLTHFINWLLPTEWALMLAAYIAFAIVLIICFGKHAKDRLWITCTSVCATALLLSILIALYS